MTADERIGLLEAAEDEAGKLVVQLEDLKAKLGRLPSKYGFWDHIARVRSALDPFRSDIGRALDHAYAERARAQRGQP